MGAALCQRDGKPEAASNGFPTGAGAAGAAGGGPRGRRAGLGPDGRRPDRRGPPDGRPHRRRASGRGSSCSIHDMSFVDRRADDDAPLHLPGLRAGRPPGRRRGLRWWPASPGCRGRPSCGRSCSPRSAPAEAGHAAALPAAPLRRARPRLEPGARGGAGPRPAGRRSGSSRCCAAASGGEGILVVANREPYIHERGGTGTVRCVAPGQRPGHRARAGACGPARAPGSPTAAASADREVVDARDRVRGAARRGSRYTLRRVWLTEEEEQGYYYGFANEGLWPLCHIAHTRPEFRGADWEHYRARQPALRRGGVPRRPSVAGPHRPGAGLPLRARCRG
ncbi:MAG: hypothetical protein M0C28_40815 [Candidatus Moduliflexus flocculans]|nr:hypothetical protein [Candidatus Moduliflexus flocculans]